MTMKAGGFDFDRTPAPNGRIGVKFHEVFYRSTFIGYMWEIEGRWHADHTPVFHVGSKPTVQGFDMLEVARAEGWTPWHLDRGLA